MNVVMIYFYSKRFRYAPPFNDPIATESKGRLKTPDFHAQYDPIVGCANKDLDGSLGPLGKFIEYCRNVALLPVIRLGKRSNW